MANIINMGGGSSYPVLLASVTSVPTSATAISGTETWKKYDAIYFECFMHYKNASDKSVNTNLILTKNVSSGDTYQLIRVTTSSGDGSELNIRGYFSENVLRAYKVVHGGYDVTKLNIYGVNF